MDIRPTRFIGFGSGRLSLYRIQVKSSSDAAGLHPQRVGPYRKRPGPSADLGRRGSRVHRPSLLPEHSGLLGDLLGFADSAPGAHLLLGWRMGSFAPGQQVRRETHASSLKRAGILRDCPPPPYVTQRERACANARPACLGTRSQHRLPGYQHSSGCRDAAG